MPSSPSARTPRASLVLRTALALALAGCGADTDPSCDRSFLRYDNFGAPFIANWCRACHSAEVPPDMRQEAPVGVNFDSPREIRAWSYRISVTTGVIDSMPPAGGPSPAERQMLVEWLGCGAP
ncbi:MAG: hypothetical protein E6J90_40155 [Deltaproteobacteria bacterium]|nr:MAG: hypothetical protein E6J90_40155 [Deltaproteobacteria bacterium]TMQ14593.1 MAG: hypothetical protein E6J91_14935 [Deltaproteobacteria bacterium]